MTAAAGVAGGTDVTAAAEDFVPGWWDDVSEADYHASPLVSVAA